MYTADDAFNPSIDRDFHGYVFPQPGPGMFAEMVKKLFPNPKPNPKPNSKPTPTLT